MMRIDMKYIMLLFAGVLLTSCGAFDEIENSDKITPITVKVNLEVVVDNLESVTGLTLKFDNYDEDLHYSKEVVTGSIEVKDIIPGIYTISASGTAIDTDGNEYYVNGSVVNKALYKGEQDLDLSAKGLKVSPLVFKEIYYAGVFKNYFQDQFYEIYNNSGSVINLDGIYFADLYPTSATTKLPNWEDATVDGDNYVYANRVWRFPGKGTDYPLQPGESCIIAQYAINHTLVEGLTPDSPVDNSVAEFDFCMDNSKYPNQPAVDMLHVFYRGKAEKGTVAQYLTPVKGGAFVIFEVPEGEEWDPVDDPTLQANEVNKSILYAKIPIDYVMDAVECVDNESKVNAKRVPGVLDAGCTWVGATYNGLGIYRRQSVDASGNPIQRENGAYLYQDTNNSTDDFVREVTPMHRRFGAKMPSWNHTLQ